MKKRKDGFARLYTVNRQLEDSNFHWDRKKLCQNVPVGEVPVERIASWRKCQLGLFYSFSLSIPESEKILKNCQRDGVFPKDRAFFIFI